jgi:hypothetical protein
VPVLPRVAARGGGPGAGRGPAAHVWAAPLAQGAVCEVGGGVGGVRGAFAVILVVLGAILS